MILCHVNRTYDFYSLWIKLFHIDMTHWISQNDVLDDTRNQSI